MLFLANNVVAPSSTVGKYAVLKQVSLTQPNASVASSDKVKSEEVVNRRGKENKYIAENTCFNFHPVPFAVS